MRQKKLCRILDEPLKHNDEFYQMFNDLTFEIVKKINKIQNDDLIWLQDSKTTQLIDMIDLVDKAYTDFMKYYRNDYKHEPYLYAIQIIKHNIK
ncbi:MAG: hypothetical protein M0R46_16940 [Candidatus Muirbacterium halophilum]|nr:hypothetical protein [Candidatus Muirbacterium halophilum]